MEYERLTDKDIVVTLNYNAYEDNTRFFNYAHRLWELENAIENGELDRKDNSYNVLELEYLRRYKENREKVYIPIEPTVSWFMGIKVRNEAKCSACNQKLSNEYEQFNYCPYCGARLR